MKTLLSYLTAAALGACCATWLIIGHGGTLALPLVAIAGRLVQASTAATTTLAVYPGSGDIVTPPIEAKPIATAKRGK
jgi:hypothetical protein